MSRFFQSRNNKLAYYLNGHLKRLYPKKLLTLDLEKLQKSIIDFDEEKMYERVNYYNKLDRGFELDQKIERIEEISSRHGTYSLDLMEYTRFFPQSYQLGYLFGDITHVPEMPSVTKSRPVHNNINSVLMKFDKVRHFYFVDDKTNFRNKKDKLIWRGAAHQQHRKDFLNQYYDRSHLLDVGEFNKNPGDQGAYKAPFVTIQEQLQSKFLLAIEGNDVATNTKWIMSSNSLCLMAKPKYETWFMEGALVPNYHYALVKEDYSNLEEVVNYYLDHPIEAEYIIQNANTYVKQFKNKKAEDWLSLKVLEKYFYFSGQI